MDDPLTCCQAKTYVSGSHPIELKCIMDWLNPGGLLQSLTDHGIIKISRKLQHTPGAHPRQSPYPTIGGFPLQPIGKGLGVFQRCVETTFERSLLKK